MEKATTHRIIATLVNRSFVSVTADGRYHGPKILSLAGLALARRHDLGRARLPP